MTRLQANALLTLTALIWGTTFIVQQTVLTHMGPIAFTSVRFILGAIAILPFVIAERRRAKRDGIVLSGRRRLAMVATGGALFAGAVLQQLGIAQTTVTNASFLTVLYVPLVPVIGLIVTRVAPAPIVWPAAIACLIGTWLLSGAHALTIGTGDLFIIAGAVFWACHVLLIGHVGSLAPMTLAFVQFVVCAALSGVTALAVEDVSLAAMGPAWFEILYAGLLSCGLAYTLQVVAQRHTASADAAIIFSTEAVFATIAGVAVLGERPDAMVLAGCAIIAIATLAVQLVPNRRATPALDDQPA